MWWIPGLLKRFPGLGVLQTTTIVKIEVEETWLHPNLAGRLSADVAMKGHVSEIDFALFQKSLNSQLQQKSESEYDGGSDRTNHKTDYS